MDPSSPSKRKHKFAPRMPKTQAKPAKAEASSAEREEEEDVADKATQARLRRWNKQSASRKPEDDSKSNVEVAFGPGDSSSPLRTFGAGKGKSSGSASKDFADEQNDLTRSSSAIEDEKDTSMIDFTDDADATDASTCKIKKVYKEPWDYVNSNYPTTLPLRKPNSGDPEILDEEEFGENATNAEYDEDAINPAAELGFFEKSEQQRMIFFNLPATLPLEKKSVSRKGKEKSTSTAASGEPPKQGVAMKDLPKGQMGKMLIHKSGAIKLKLGETLYDVSPGPKCKCAQDIVAMNTTQKDCCILGELSKHAVVTPDLPDLDSLKL